MLLGREFEDAVELWSKEPSIFYPEYSQEPDAITPAQKKQLKHIIAFARLCAGGKWQVKTQATLDNYIFSGVADCIAMHDGLPIIYDTKRYSAGVKYDGVKKGNYRDGKYKDSIQHLVYMYMFKISRFAYLCSDVWTERNIERYYYPCRDKLETELTCKVDDFYNSIMSDDELAEIYKKNWVVEYQDSNPL